MSVTKDRPAPYAAAKSILALIDRHRNKGLPSPVDGEVLARGGIPDSLIPRTLQALQTLDLIGDDGKPSPMLEAIRLAPEAEYQHRLAEWLTAAYADALAFIDPASDDETKIRDAFRNYVPTGQQTRMVSLFIGLFTAAGLMPERVKQPARTSVPNTPRLRVVAKPYKPARDQGPRDVQRTSYKGALPPALAGLMAELPIDGRGWTKDRRDKFIQTFGVVVDFSFPVVAAEPTSMKNGD